MQQYHYLRFAVLGSWRMDFVNRIPVATNVPPVLVGTLKVLIRDKRVSLPSIFQWNFLSHIENRLSFHAAGANYSGNIAEMSLNGLRLKICPSKIIEVQMRKFWPCGNGRSIIGKSRLFRAGKTAKVSLVVVDCDPGSIIAAVGPVKHTLVRDERSLAAAAIGDILGPRGDAHVVALAVQAIAILVVNVKAGRRVHDEAMEEDLLPYAATIRQGHALCSARIALAVIAPFKDQYASRILGRDKRNFAARERDFDGRHGLGRHRRRYSWLGVGLEYLVGLITAKAFDESPLERSAQIRNPTGGELVNPFVAESHLIG